MPGHEEAVFHARLKELVTVRTCPVILTSPHDWYVYHAGALVSPRLLEIPEIRRAEGSLQIYLPWPWIGIGMQIQLTHLALGIPTVICAACTCSPA